MTSREEFEKDIIFYHVDGNREGFIRARIKTLIENNAGDNYHANLLNEFVSFGTDCWLAAEAQFKHISK